MRLSIWHCLAISSLCNGATAFPASSSVFGAMPMDSLMPRQDDDDIDFFDASDLSFITKMAAIGDSYSAGIGAGDRLGSVLEAFDTQSDWSCSRYNRAYPYAVNIDGRLGDPSTRKFQFKSCSGALTRDVLEKQIPNIDSGQQVILLSAGGNDVQLTNILNQCIFQWLVLNQEQVPLAKLAALKEDIDWAKDYDWDATGRGCEGQMAHTQQLIDSDAFSRSLDSVISAAKAKLADDGMIYYTGYAKFWDESMTPDCDKVTWTTWVYEASYLTTDKRRRMNELVDAVNAKLSAAIERAGPKVKFVDWDRYVGKLGGRMCAPGVDESTSESNTRVELMFYELNTWDPLGSSPWKRSVDEITNGTFEGNLDQFAQITLLLDPNAVYTQQGAIGGANGASLMTASFVDSLEVGVPNILPDGYGRVFHPQIMLHQLIAELVIYEMTDRNEQNHGFPPIPQDFVMDTCPLDGGDGNSVLRYQKTPPGKEVKPGTELRILCVGDSITVGFLSDQDGGDGNGYRLQLRNDLSKDEVVFAGTESTGTMSDGYFSAWSGKTIKYISDHVGSALDQRPNIILLHAGTNDMNPSNAISTEGNDPAGAASRLGDLIDQMIKACPDATILVAMIVNTCDANQSPATKAYQQLVPGVVRARRSQGHHVIAVDFTGFPTDMLRDCIHPTNAGYRVFGDYWYDFMTQVPRDWIKQPVGPDPDRNGVNSNGGLDRGIPPPDLGVSPVQRSDSGAIARAASDAGKGGRRICNSNPHWYGTGQIALGLGHNGAWHYEKNWVSAGKVADGLKMDPKYVRLHDMNGDGKADYIWLDPDTGMIICWLNNLPEPWSPAGTNNSIIGSGAGRAESVILADMNGDGMEDYMVVNPNNGAVHIWWNHGPDANWVNGWKFTDGGQIASGVPHANWATLRFPDINGDGRADYVYIGAGGSLKHHMNTGSARGEDVLFEAEGGIATGATSNVNNLVFADMDGDGRDDYLIWDDIAGLSGFLNQPTNREGVPLYINQGPAKTIADGITQSPSSIRLADLDGDGKDDYAYIDQDGAIWLWWNRGSADTSMAMDGLRFADIDGDGLDDYVWLDPNSGAPTVYINKGPNTGDVLGWLWDGLNGGKPIASGAAPAVHVQFADIDGDGKDDYLVLDPKTGALTAYLNDGPQDFEGYGWHWNPIGEIATGLGPGANVRFADIDGDGYDDYIYLHPNGGTTIYRNVWRDKTPNKWAPLPQADASGINQRPEEISFHDIDGDGKADYVWTRPKDGSVRVWYNQYPNLPTWREQGGADIAGGVGTSGNNVRFAVLQDTGRASYVAVDPNTGGVAAWLGGCDDLGPEPAQPEPPSNKPAPTQDSVCYSVSDCGQYGCPAGQSMRCTDNGTPFSGYCYCSGSLQFVALHGGGGVNGTARNNGTGIFQSGNLTSLARAYNQS